MYSLTGSQAYQRDRDLQSQMRRAAVSVLSNIAEGFERNSRAELARFLLIAKGSCGELRAQLYVALDQHYIEPRDFEELCATTLELGRLLGALRASALRPKAEKS